MGKAVFDMGVRPEVEIHSCESDLWVEGGAEANITLETDDSAPSYEQNDNKLVIHSCDDDMRLKVPREATVRVDHVEGDASFYGFENLSVDHIAGDINVQNISASCNINRVEGDAHFASVHRLSIDSVAGDLALNDAFDTLHIGTIEGDALISGPVAELDDLHVEGDLVLNARFDSGKTYSATVEGDAFVSIPENADLTIHATVEGDVMGLNGFSSDEAYSRTWGNGSALLDLRVQGDLGVREGDSDLGRAINNMVSEVVSSTDIGGLVNSVVNQAVSSINSAFGSGRGRWSTHQEPDADAPPARYVYSASGQTEGASTPDESVEEVLEKVARGEMSPEEADRRLRT